MKTGRSKSARDLPDSFCIPILGFDALLKRCGFKDSVLFKNHNPSYIMNEHLFASGVCFNLFSEYGIGKKLEPLMKEILTNSEIDPEKNMDNIYFQEIVNMAKTIKSVLMKEDPKLENDWTYEYAIKSLMKIDQISSDRFKRLLPLFEEISDIVEFPEDISDIVEFPEDISEFPKSFQFDHHYDYQEKEEIEIEICHCGFCKEFRKFNGPKDTHIDRIILNTVLNISS